VATQDQLTEDMLHPTMTTLKEEKMKLLYIKINMCIFRYMYVSKSMQQYLIKPESKTQTHAHTHTRGSNYWSRELN